MVVVSYKQIVPLVVHVVNTRYLTLKGFRIIILRHMADPYDLGVGEGALDQAQLEQLGANHPAEVLFQAQSVAAPLEHFVTPVDPARDARADASPEAARAKEVYHRAIVDGSVKILQVVREQG